MPARLLLTAGGHEVKKSADDEFPETMITMGTRPFQLFLIGWLILGSTAQLTLALVRTPYTKWVLTRVSGIATGAALVIGAWFFIREPGTVVFAAISTTMIVILNFVIVRVCPQCAKTIYPRTQLALSFCPRCGAMLDGPHRRKTPVA